jgi:hypothetical protein
MDRFCSSWHVFVTFVSRWSRIMRKRSAEKPGWESSKPMRRPQGLPFRCPTARTHLFEKDPTMKAQFQARIPYRSVPPLNRQTTPGLSTATHLRAGYCTGQAANQCYADYQMRMTRPELMSSNNEAYKHCMNSCGGEAWV